MQAHMNQRRRLRASLLFLLPLLFTFVCFNLIPALTGILPTKRSFVKACKVSMAAKRQRRMKATSF